MHASSVLRYRLLAALAVAVVAAMFVGIAGATPMDTSLTEQVAKLTASDAASGDIFGYAVDVSGHTTVVGARKDDDKGTDSGAAYIFVPSGTTWAPQAKLTASDGAAGDEFGYCVRISGDTAIVGVPYDDDKGADSGAAYVFVRSGTTWTQQAKLTASDGAASDYFGWSVAVSGDTAVVGALGDGDKGPSSGSAYVFVRSGTTWTQQAKLTASDGAAGDSFAISLAVTGDTAVVGAWHDDDKGADSGSAYVFVRSGTAWTQQAKLTASDGAVNDIFGYTVSVSGDTAVVTAHFDDDKGADSGSAYVFVRSGTAWTQQAKLTASDGLPEDYFGMSVAVTGDTAVIGAHQDDDLGTQSGSAYVFVRSGTAWTQRDKLTASDGATGDLFGISVGVSGDTAIVGAWWNDDAGADSGSAYVFSLATPGAVTYQLHYTAGTGGTISGAASQTVDSGGSGTAVTAVADPGYSFVQWSDGFLRAARTDIEVTEDVNVTAIFALTAPTSITIRTAATSTTIGKTVPLSGAVTPMGMIGVNIVVYVMKPGKTYWTYSSNRTVYSLGGSPAWLYKYYFKPGMARGSYKFKARAPAPGFASSEGFATSESPTTVTIRVK